MDIPPHTTPHLPSPPPPPLIPLVAPIRPPKPAHLSSVRNLAQVGSVRHRATNSELDVVRSEAAGLKGQLLVEEFALGAGGARPAYPQMPRWSLNSDTRSSRSGIVSEVTENEVCASNLGKVVQSKVDELSLEMMGSVKSGTKLDRPKASPTSFSKREIEASTLHRSASSSSLPPASRSSDFSTLRPFIPISQNPYFNNLPSSPPSPSPFPSHPSGPTLQKALSHHPFQGHSEFNELSFSRGEILFIELEDLGGGWSLGFRQLEGVEERGLVPRGWYAFVEGEEGVEGGVGREGGSTKGLDGFGEVISEGAEDEEKLKPTEIEGRHQQGLKKDSDTPTMATCESSDHLVEPYEVVATLQPSNGLDPEAAWSEMIAQAERNSEEGMHGLREEVEQGSFETPVDNNLGASDRPLLDSHQPEEPPDIDLSFPNLSLSLEPEQGLLAVNESVAEPSPLTPSPLVPKTRADSQILDWILYGEGATTKEIEAAEEVQLFHIESGPAWKDPLPDLSIRVHDPELFHPPRGSAYTLYSITTNFHSEPNSTDENSLPPPITITRRFSHFVHLHTLLCSSYPILVIPDLPSRAYARRFEPGFLESRCRDLQRWIRRVVRHPVLKGTNELRDFLILENEEGKSEHLLLSNQQTAVLPGPSFFSRVYHPEYNIDIDEARETIERFELHNKAVELGNGVKEVEVGLGNYREAVFGAAQIISSLGRSLVRLVAGSAIPPLSQEPLSLRALQGITTSLNERAKQWCVQTEQGAFSWKESTESESLSMTKAVQETGETLMSVGEVWEGSAQDSLLKQQEMLKELDRPHTQYLPLVETHRLVLLEHERLSCLIDQSTKDSDRYQECLSRCETILNITSAELERVHVERREDLKEVARSILEGQIKGCEEALHHLRFAQAHFDPPQAYAALALTGPRLVSKLEESFTPSVSGPELRRELKQPSSYTGLPSGASLAQGGNVLTGPIGMVAGAMASVTTRSRNSTPMGLQRSNTAGTAYRRARYDDHVAASSSKTWTQSLFMGTIGRG